VPATGLSASIVARFARALPRHVPALVALRVDGRIAGRITAQRAARLARFGDTFSRDAHGLALLTRGATTAHRTEALDRVARTLAAEDALSAWRDERYAVAPAFGAAPWFHLERAAARYFGVRTCAAHVNGLVRGGEGVTMWVARRSVTKAIDPGMLDNLVGGGIAARTSVAATVTKESWEEAGIAADLASTARPTCALRVTRLLPDGLQDETLFVHDLWLPSSFTPVNQDGEAQDHARHALPAMARIVARDMGPDAMTVDASLVALTVLVREGTFDDDPPGKAAIVALLAGLADADPGLAGFARHQALPDY